MARNPNALDVERMRRAMAIVTAYDLGVETNDFSAFLELTGEEEHPEGMVQAMSQLAWLFLRSMDNSGIPKDNVLDWYGTRFAAKHEEMRG